MRIASFLRRHQIELLQTTINPTLPAEVIAEKIAELEAPLPAPVEPESWNSPLINSPIVLPGMDNG